MHYQAAARGSVIIMTLMLIVLLTIEVATISLVGIRSLSQEGVLMGQNSGARRGTEIAIQRLETALYQGARGGTSLATLFNQYKLSGSLSTYSNASTLALTNPETGASDTTSSNTRISSWIQERRGYYFHLVGRAQVGLVDLLSHKWVFINPCFSSGTGVLSTIVSNAVTPGFASARVDSSGRVVFGEGSAGSKLWSWKAGVLSTLLTGITAVGYQSLLVDGNDRFYFGVGTNTYGHMYTWKSGVLSTLTPSTISGPGYSYDNGSPAMALDSNKTFYFSAGNDGGRIYTWSSTTNKLSTILGTGSGVYKAIQTALPGRIFFHLEGSPYVHTWSQSTGLSTSGSVTMCSNCTSMNIAPDSSGYADFGDHWWNNSGNKTSRWVWNSNSNVLTTLTFRTLEDNSGLENVSNTHVFGDWYGVYSWNANVLTTIVTGGDANSSLRATPTGRVYFRGNGNFYTWLPNVLSTVLNSTNTPFVSAVVNERIYFNEYDDNPGRVYTYDPAYGLSTILASGAKPGGLGWGEIAGRNENRYPAHYASLAVNSAGRVLFGENIASTATVRSWQPGLGLTTVLTGRSYLGVRSTESSSSSTGFYFGENTNPGNFYYWTLLSSCDTRGY